MLGGAIMTIVYVALQTDSGPADWYHTVVTGHATKTLKFFDHNPFTRSTILTVAVSMFVWHVCTHLGNQMTVQRYFSTGSTKDARRSFVVGSLTGVLINLLLLVVGLALFHYYAGNPRPEGLDPTTNQADKIFPRFAMHRLPAGLAGAWLSAMLAAAMSSIDSGINSASSVLTVEWHRRFPRDAEEAKGGGLRGAKMLTLVLGLAITGAAFALDVLTRGRNIIEMMGRSFNCFTGPLGGLFLLGMFAPRVGNRGATTAGLAGLVVSIGIAYSRELFGLPQSISFTWIQPGSLLVTLTVGLLLIPLDRPNPSLRSRLVWRGRPPP
jgi:SSS family solute:Na+ symporter